MYLRTRDFYKQIQSDQIAQITGSDSSLLTSSQLAAQEEIGSYLGKRYDLTKEFRDIQAYSLTTIYKGKNIIELNAPAYVNATAYTVAGKDMVSNAGLVYICKTNTTGTFDVTKWTLLGTQYDLYYVSLPYDEFSLATNYKVGDKVFWKDFVYSCLIPTQVLDHDSALQYREYSNIPLKNAFPDDALNGSTYWLKGAAFSVTNLLVTGAQQDGTAFSAWSAITAYTATTRVVLDGVLYECVIANTGVSPDSDITKWKKVSWTVGDIRSQLLVMYMIDMTLYHLHSRISPRNIPELRVDRYDAACSWLKKASKGDVQANIPNVQPKQGRRIRFGSNVKNINDY